MPTEEEKQNDRFRRGNIYLLTKIRSYHYPMLVSNRRDF